MTSDEIATEAELRFGNPTDEQLMQTYRPPAYSPPYPVVINSNFSSRLLKEKTDQWMQHLKVDTIFSPKIYQMLESMDACGLPARMYTEASESRLEWAGKFFLMLWIWDDTLDSTETGQSPAKALGLMLEVHLMMLWSFPDDPVLRTQLEPFLNHLEGQALEEKVRYIESVLAEARTQPGKVYPKPTSNIACDVYVELWNEVIASASPEFCLRLAHSIQQWLLGCHMETEYRNLKTVPSSIDKYIQIRKGSSAIPTTVVLVDFVYGLSTPDNWFYSPQMQSMMEAVNDVVGWHNDLWSFKREVLVEKDKFNMVLVNSIYRKVSYTEAAEITTQMIYDRISDFEQDAKDLESVTPPELIRNFQLYVTSCRNLVSGTHDWHSQSVRYQ